MFKHVILGALALFFLGIASASGQSVCPLNGTSSSKLVCVIPQVYGPLGLATGGPLRTAGGHEAHFGSEFTDRLGPINADVGIQVSQLPLASPSSGITFTYDPSLKTFTPSTDESLGPIIGERASTIGRHKLFVGFSYQYFKFNSIDGQKISDIPVVLEHQPALPNLQKGFTACPNQTGLPPAYSGDTCYVRDFIRTIYNVDLRVNQYTVYFTYGVTRHLDLSLAMPFLNVRMDVVSNTTIVQNSVVDPSFMIPGNVFHQFDSSRVQGCVGVPVPCLNASFSNSGSATGIGDLVLRGKYEVYKGEKAGFALGMDVRLPTGDEENYLGSGAAGFKPFGVFSYRARVSPHAEIGYEVNGDSILAGKFVEVPANTKGSLPNRLVYIVGADVNINKRITGAFDIYGQRLFGAPQLFSSPHTDFGKCSDVDCTIFTPGTTHPNVSEKDNRDFNITNASLGVKLRLIRNLVATGNVLLKLDDGGLRARVVPLVGVSYSF